MTTSPETPLTQSTTEYLNHNAIASALAYLTDVWPHLPMTTAMREAWEDILCQLHPGELKPALALMPSKFRPDPYPLLEKILAGRARVQTKDRHEAEHDATQRRLAEQRKPVQTGATHVTDVLTKTRAVLGVERKPHADRPEAKAAMLDEAKVAFRHYVETADDPTGTAATDAWRALAAILAPESAS